MPDNFGFIYDWMEDQPLPDEYTQYDVEGGREDLLLKLWQEQTANIDDPLPYEEWKKTYGKYINEYSYAKEDLIQESFDIKYEQTEKLFDLKSDQEERDYDLIEKYASVDDSDDFESITEMDIRHAKEMDKVDQRTNRLKLISEGVTLNQKKKIAGDKTLLKNIRTGDTDRVVSELDKTFWNNMKVVRSEYDKQRVNRTQALDALILKADQTVESAFKAKEDSIESLFVSSEGKMKNAAVDLLGDKVALREDYEGEIWDTMGELAAGDAFLGKCAGVACGSGEVCNPSTGDCIPDAATRKATCEGYSGEGTATWVDEPDTPLGGHCTTDLTNRDSEGNFVECDSDNDCGECSDCIAYKCTTDLTCAEEKWKKACSDDGSVGTPGGFSLGDDDPCECPCLFDETTQQHRDCLGNSCTSVPDPFN